MPALAESLKNVTPGEEAMPFPPFSDGQAVVTLVAMGCGPGWTRGGAGHCHPIHYGAPVYGAPSVAVGVTVRVIGTVSGIVDVALATFAGLVATIVTVPVYVPTPKPAGFAVTVMFEGVGPVAVLIRSQFAAGFVPAVA